LPGWLPWAAAAVAVLLLLLLVARLSGRDPETGTASGQDTASASPDAQPSRSACESASESASEAGTPATKKASTRPSPSPSASPSEDNRIAVNAGDYVGRPKDEAEKDLEDLGFEVEDEKVDNPGGAEKDTVADVSPTGLVEPGRTITLSVFDDPVEVEIPPTDGEDGDNSGKGNGDGGNGDGGNGKGKGSEKQ
jgi:serine/threonine-protein kinase